MDFDTIVTVVIVFGAVVVLFYMIFYDEMR